MPVETKYLLPCSCGRKIPIQPARAGQEIRCTCGASLDVPTMLEMATLQRAQPETASEQPVGSWGIRQSLVLLGVVITLTAVGLEIGLYLTRPAMFTPDQIRQWVRADSPLESWNRWLAMRAGGLEPVNTRRSEKKFDEAVIRHRVWMGVVFVFAAGGIALIVVPVLRARKKATVRNPRSS